VIIHCVASNHFKRVAVKREVTVLIFMQDNKWRDLYWKAMHEKDVNNLLTFSRNGIVRQKANRWTYFPRPSESTDKSDTKKIGCD